MSAKCDTGLSAARGPRRRLVLSSLLICGAVVASTIACHAQIPNLDGMFGQQQQGPTWARITQLTMLITGLSVAPGLMMMVTCFPRFLIVFSFLRSGLGLPSTPSNVVLVGLALFMTMFVMAPAIDRAWNEGLKPLGDNRIKPEDAAARMIAPFREFMQANTRPKDLQFFSALAVEKIKLAPEAIAGDLRVIAPAFMISELRRGFEIGFLVMLPFLVIDLVVATVVMSMGMMMLSPQAFSVPLKVLFFVLIDGWGLLVGSLVRSVA